MARTPAEARRMVVVETEFEGVVEAMVRRDCDVSSSGRSRSVSLGPVAMSQRVIRMSRMS